MVVEWVRHILLETSGFFFPIDCSETKSLPDSVNGQCCSGAAGSGTRGRSHLDSGLKPDSSRQVLGVSVGKNDVRFPHILVG